MRPSLATCPQCNHPLPATGYFCIHCGQAVPRAITGDTVAVTPAAAAPLQTAQVAGQWQAGTTVGDHQRYQVERALARGGFGETYLATDRSLKRQCVIKRMLVNPAWSAAEQQTARDNFVREAQLLASLATPGHPNIPEIYEYLEAETCLILKYVKGRNLDQANPKLPAAEALAHVRDIASALAYMHSRVPTVLHRDIKPGNILLADDGRVWLIDFGLSKSTPLQAAGAAPTGSPAATTMAGTFGYTPPEQWQSAASEKSDVYALAATLHTLLTGYIPLFGERDLPELVAGTKGAFPPASSFEPAIDRRVERLIQRGMAFEPRQRPTAREFLDEITRVLQPAAGAAKVVTPTGAIVSTLDELGRWCCDNWYEAREWLSGKLPDVIETGFLNAQLAKMVRDLRARHPHDRNAALDQIIELLAPSIGRTRAIQISPSPIDFGNLTAAGATASKDIAIINTGQRYLSLELQGEGWLRVARPESPQNRVLVALLPGTQQIVTLYTDMAYQANGRQIAAALLVAGQGLSQRHQALAVLSRWAVRARLPAAAAAPAQGRASGFWAAITILMLVCAGSSLIKNWNRSPGSARPPVAMIGTPGAGAEPTITALPPATATDAPVAPTPFPIEATPSDPPTAVPLRKARITGANALNIRAEPRASSQDVGDISAGTVFELTGEEANGWYRVRSGSTEGWVNGKYVEILP